MDQGGLARHVIGSERISLLLTWNLVDLQEILMVQSRLARHLTGSGWISMGSDSLRVDYHGV